MSNKAECIVCGAPATTAITANTRRQLFCDDCANRERRGLDEKSISYHSDPLIGGYLPVEVINWSSGDVTVVANQRDCEDPDEFKRVVEAHYGRVVRRVRVHVGYYWAADLSREAVIVKKPDRPTLEHIRARFCAAHRLSTAQLADYDWQQLGIDLADCFGAFTLDIAAETCCDDWQAVAKAITEDAIDDLSSCLE